MDASAEPQGTVFARRNYNGGIAAICTHCGGKTTVDFGVITNSCPHITVRFYDGGASR